MTTELSASNQCSLVAPVLSEQPGAERCALCSAFSHLLAQSSGTPAMPSRLIRQRDVSNDPVLKTVCESVQSALNMPYICKHRSQTCPLLADPGQRSCVQEVNALGASKLQSICMQQIVSLVRHYSSTLVAVQTVAFMSHFAPAGDLLSDTGVCGAGVTALGNRRILTVALSSMPQEARMFGTGPFCSWLLEPCMPGLHSVPDCQADPMYVHLVHLR